MKLATTDGDVDVDVDVACSTSKPREMTPRAWGGAFGFGPPPPPSGLATPFWLAPLQASPARQSATGRSEEKGERRPSFMGGEGPSTRSYAAAWWIFLPH